MIYFKRTDGLPEYKEFINRHLGYFYMSDTIRNALFYDNRVLLTYMEYLSEMMRLKTSDKLANPSSAATVKEFLMNYCEVKAKDLTFKDASSLNKEVLKGLLDNPKAHDFIKLYSQFTSTRSVLGKMNNLIDKAERTTKTDVYGNSLYKWYYTMEERSTGRVYAVGTAYQNISKIYTPFICEEKDRALISCDFSAFEVTIQYYLVYRTPELDEGFLLCDDPYEFMYYVINPNGKEFTKELRDVWKTPYLAAVYNQHQEVTAKQLNDADLAKRLHAWLDNNPKRLNYMKKVATQFEKKGFVTANTYWGRVITSEPKEGTTKSSILNKFANVPIQGTGHDIIAKYGLEVLRRMEERGIPKNSIGFMMSRHDEPVFSVPVNKLDIAYEVMQECSLVQVDDWRPFRVTAKFQFSYGKTEVEAVPPKLSLEDISVVKTTKSNYFCPIKESNTLRIGHFSTVTLQGELIHVLYGYNMSTAGIQAKVFKNYTTMRKALDILLYNTVCEFPNDDLEVITTIPITVAAEATFKMIKEEGLSTDIKQTVVSANHIDFNIVTSLLQKAGILEDVLLPIRGVINDYNFEPIEVKRFSEEVS